MPAQAARIHIRSLGCKVNLADAAAVVDLLPPAQVRLVGSPTEADLVILNTCVVTHKAERDVRKILGSLGRDQPHLPVVVTGCAATLNGSALSAFQNVRAVVRPGDPSAIARLIGEVCGVDLRPAPAVGPASPFMRLERHRAILKVQDGCNSSCAYCIVPKVRGPERSFPPEEVLSRIRAFTAAGHLELVLSGIHLGRYGRDQNPPVALAGLIESLSPVFGELGPDYRMRLSSIEPLEWTGELLDVLSAASFVCPHFHVPLQSGDDDVLGRMGRPYRADQFIQVISELRRRFPEAALGTDVLVGFPGESDGQAANTLEVVGSAELSYLHVFTFSARPGTCAEKMPGQVDPGVVRERAARVRETGQRLWLGFLEQGVGQTHQVLIEKTTSRGAEGRSGSYRPVRITGTRHAAGLMVRAAAEFLEDETLVAND